MELLERESKKRSLELKKAKHAEEMKKHRAKKMLENPTETRGKHAEEEKKSMAKKTSTAQLRSAQISSALIEYLIKLS